MSDNFTVEILPCRTEMRFEDNKAYIIKIKTGNQIIEGRYIGAKNKDNKRFLCFDSSRRYFNSISSITPDEIAEIIGEVEIDQKDMAEGLAM